MVGGYLAIAVLDEQEAVDRTAEFLTSEIGWKVAQDVADSPTDRDVVLEASGELDSGNGLTRYIRLRGNSNSIYLYTYETFTSVSVNTGEVSDVTYGLLNVGTSAAGFRLVVVADQERVVLHCELSDGTKRQSYVGRIKSYYRAQDFPYPNIVKGCQSTTYDWYYTAAERNSWMRAPDGTQQHYFAVEPISSTALDASGVSARTGEFVIAAPILTHNTISGNKELVGEPRGLFRVPTEVEDHNNFISLDGELYAVLESNSKAWAVGPITVSGVDSVRAETDLTV
jgi:hypothetical protein